MIYHTHGATSYTDVKTRHSLRDLAATVRDATADLKEHRDEFDCIVVTGMSGVIVGVPLALRLRKPVVVLRKAGEKTHQRMHDGWVNHSDLGERCLFVDDFISGGTTFRRVVDAVKGQQKRVVARYLYYDREYRAI